MKSTSATGQRSSGFAVTRNLSANLVGKALTAVLGFAFIPLYVRFLGMEAYGLVGLYATITALCFAADCGLSATVSRELARLSVQPNSTMAMRNLVRTLEAGTWIIAAGLGLLVAFSASFIASGWLGRTALSPDTVRNAIMAMGIALFLQWPVNYYSNALIGLQRQVGLNLINVGMATLRGLGAVAVLWGISSTIEAFLVWQIFISACHVICVALQMWRLLPGGGLRARVRLAAIRQAWRFTAGMSGLMLVTVLHSQVDKLILSQMLTLTSFGYYTLAWTVALSLFMLCDPIALAFLPHMTQLVSLDDKAGLAIAYHKAAQIMSVAILPATIFLALFAPEILAVWTKNPVIAEQSAPLVAILVVGTGLQAMAIIPTALQWAYGMTSIALWSQLTALLVQIPLCYVLAHHYGAIGGACTWLLTNAAILIVTVPLIHRRQLRGELRRWLLRDLMPPLAAALLAAALWRQIETPESTIALLLFLAAAATTTFLSAVIAVPLGRRIIAASFRRFASAISFGWAP